MNSIPKIISDSIRKGKWVYVSYLNMDGETTYFWLGIKDITENRKLKVDMYNPSNGDKVIETIIYFDKILTAEVLEFTNFDINENLIEKIENNLLKYDWLKYEQFNNNILVYLSECNKLNKDPFIVKYNLISGIDKHSFDEYRKIYLTKEQEDEVIKVIKNYDIKKSNYQFNELALSILSIDEGGKKYLVGYYNITYNPKDKTIRRGDELQINKNFLVDGIKHSLYNYLDENPENFAEDLKNEITFRGAVERLRNNLKTEKINEKPDFFILQRDISTNFEKVISKIEKAKENNTLNLPVKAFFGDVTQKDYSFRRLKPAIVVYDKKINLDQMRVLYNSMKFPVTAVQGPPGTGKTQTILNVILSAFFNNKTTLICSGNNIPVNNIAEKLNFSYDSKKIEFPFIRLGNNEENQKAIEKIKKLFEFNTKDEPIDSKIENIKTISKRKGEELVDLLSKYETRLSKQENIESIQKLLSKFDNIGQTKGIFGWFGGNIEIKDKIKNYLKELEKELQEIPEISNKDAISKVIIASEDKKFNQYLYYESLKYIKKLKQKKYVNLIKIAYIKDEDKKIKEFNKWLSNDENMEMFLDVFPIILSTNVSSNKFGKSKFYFDLVVMDESGQCDIGTSLIPISIAKNLLLVGDPDQLKPVVILEKSINKKLMKRYEISPDYDFTEQSIFALLEKKNVIKSPIFLSYHYRCGEKIIEFSNQRYYNQKLKLNNIKEEGNLELIKVKNQSVDEKNSYFEEAMEIVDYIKRNNYKNIFIITPFKNQSNLINAILEKENIKNVEAGTIHSTQGKEAETVILSTAISPKTSKRTYDWLKNNEELINVAVTRAKNNLVVVADTDSIKILSDKTDDLYSLIDYVENKGNIKVGLSRLKQIEIGKSRGSKNEDDFFETISHFCSVYEFYEVKRNVLVKDVFGDDEELRNCGQEYDCVLYEKTTGTLIPKIAIEINGGEHVGDVKREFLDEKKIEISKNRGIKQISISNDFVKSYEFVRELLFGMNNQTVEQIELC